MHRILNVSPMGMDIIVSMDEKYSTSSSVYLFWTRNTPRRVCLYLLWTRNTPRRVCMYLFKTRIRPFYFSDATIIVDYVDALSPEGRARVLEIWCRMYYINSGASVGETRDVYRRLETKILVKKRQYLSRKRLTRRGYFIPTVSYDPYRSV